MGEFVLGSLTGRVLDPSTGNPVETAEVTIRGTDLRRLTDPEGRFAFEQVPPGPHDLEVEHLGNDCGVILVWTR